MTPTSAHNNPATSVATLITDEQSARRMMDLIAESFEEAVVAVSEAGRGIWRVTAYFHGAADKSVLRALAVAAVGRTVGRNLRFARVTPKDWVGESLAGLKPVEAGRFVVHGAHDRARIPVNRIGI
jgi:ribosomal protein L11 methyltransferase